MAGWRGAVLEPGGFWFQKTPALAESGTGTLEHSQPFQSTNTSSTSSTYMFYLEFYDDPHWKGRPPPNKKNNFSVKTLSLQQ